MNVQVTRHGKSLGVEVNYETDFPEILLDEVAWCGELNDNIILTNAEVEAFAQIAYYSEVDKLADQAERDR